MYDILLEPLPACFFFFFCLFCPFFSFPPPFFFFFFFFFFFSWLVCENGIPLAVCCGISFLRKYHTLLMGLNYYGASGAAWVLTLRECGWNAAGGL